jgi:HK97 gp10 family phage protein
MPTITVRARSDFSAGRRWQREKQAVVAAVVAKYTHLITREAKARAPIDTGFLRSNIEADVSRVLRDAVGYVISGADYSSFVEFGTSRMAAQPFMFPAYEANARAFYDELKAALR